MDAKQSDDRIAHTFVFAPTLAVAIRPEAWIKNLLEDGMDWYFRIIQEQESILSVDTSSQY